MLLAEIHHRVKNNLAVVSGMMQLQAYGETDKEIKEKLLDSVARIGSMATIHEQLYQSGSFSKLNFSENLTALVNKVFDMMNTQSEIALTLDLEPIMLNVNLAIPCSLIVNEVVTNIIKHAFKQGEKGEVILSLSEKEGQIHLSIKDNGVGLPENFNSDDSSSLGLKLIDILAKQLEADYGYNSLEQGTEFSIRFYNSEIRGTGSSNV